MHPGNDFEHQAFLENLTSLLIIIVLMGMAVGEGNDEPGQYAAAIYNPTPELAGLPPAAIGGVVAKANEDGQCRTYDTDGGEVEHQLLLKCIFVKAPDQHRP